jgi:hypothetical protein
MSTMLDTLLLYPDHPYGVGTLYGKEFDEDLKRNIRFVIAETRDLPEEQLYSKERKLIEEIRRELAEERRCQVFAVYTQKHDVTARLQRILASEGIRTEILRASVDTSKREAWYARQIREGVQVVISHPKLVETGLDLLDFPTILFYESGYSLHTLRQPSGRSWRIGQRRPVRVKSLCYEGTTQTACLRLMGVLPRYQSRFGMHRAPRQNSVRARKSTILHNFLNLKICYDYGTCSTSPG